MTILRTFTAATAGAISMVALAAPLCARAQTASDRLQECARIEDPAARLACYDSQLRSGDAIADAIPAPVGVEPAPASPSVQAPAPAPTQAAPTSPSVAANDFGLPEPRKELAPDDLRITATVAEVRPRQPGIYLVTLEDGAQWLFTEGVRRTYRVPRKGSSITIESAALDSFLMRFDKQAAVRVERVR